MNNSVISGRLTKAIDVRYLKDGKTAIGKCTLAVDRGLSKAKKEELKAQGKPTCDFIRCNIWGQQAEFLDNYSDKGTLIAVKGKIETGSYEDKDGKTIYTTEIRADSYGGVEILEWKKSENEKKDEVTDGFKELDDADIGDSIPF